MFRRAASGARRLNRVSKCVSHQRRAASQLANDPVIVSAVRTPVVSFSGSLSSMTATQLGSVAVKAALEKAQIQNKAEIDEVLLGNVISAGLGQAPARQVSLGAGIPDTVDCTTINKVCASGMKTVTLAAQTIMAGSNKVVVTGGFESMSNVPYYLPKARSGYRYGHGQLIDGLLFDGLWDVYNQHHMGVCGEVCASKYSFTREQQDEYAILSYTRTAQATQARAFQSEICPVSVPSPKKGGKDTLVTEDEEYKKADFDKMKKLSPAFQKQNGTVTAANSSALNDGASALIVMSHAEALRRGLKPLARIIGFADAATAPIDFTIAPSLAIPKAVERAGIRMEEVDFFEINEAFAVVALANGKLMGIDKERLNVNGGAVGIGHPIGSSGARITVTLAHLLQNRNGRYGVAGICNGGGAATAIVLERL
eukprot:TRINITY_DN2695_c0_g1_i1.p1 TRINITY_DN2695_c0_g1~~TRINITY_DN2695_c0_g1_i1.p1  ORF type:complete len:426 (-),score=131.44 TRINITY_DN2695_c0_g1_i1:39-1316(-)